MKDRSLGANLIAPNIDTGGIAMRFGLIAPGNPSTNALIYQCFQYLKEADVLAFVKKFREQVNDQDQVVHTFRELIAGAYVAAHGFDPEYEPEIDNRTPDWRFTDPTNGKPFIMELVNFHPDQETRNDQDAVMESGEPLPTWTGWMKPTAKRLYPSLQTKAAAYKQMVHAHSFPYVIALHTAFSAAVFLDEVEECLAPSDGVFPNYPEVSGVLFFQEGGGFGGVPMAYRFHYLANPAAIYPISIPEGAVRIPLPGIDAERTAVQ